jgi:hypothetical protein
MKTPMHAMILTVWLATTAVTVSAQSAPGDDPNAIVGTWLATVTNLVPPPGAFTSFLSLATFFDGGQATEDANAPTLRSAAQGEWFRAAPRQFVRTMYILNFVSPHTFTGITKAITKIIVAEDGNQYDAFATFQVYDPMGNLLTNGSNTSHGRRCSFGTTVPQCMDLVP